MSVEITREGNGAHRAGHTWKLSIDGKYIGIYETKTQAIQAAIDSKENWG